MKRNRFVRTVRAEVLSKNVEQWNIQTGIAGDSMMARGLESPCNVQYRITFGTQDGKVLYLGVPLELYLSLEQGMKGTLRHSGKFQSFETDDEFKNMNH